MRIRNVVIVFTVMLLVVYGSLISTIAATQINQVDVTEINGIVKSIEKDWADGVAKKSGTVGAMSYQIALVGDENYQALLFDGIKNRQTIIDLTESAADG